MHVESAHIERYRVERFECFEQGGCGHLYVVANGALVELDEASTRLAKHLEGRHRQLLVHHDLEETLRRSGAAGREAEILTAFRKLGVLVPAHFPRAPGDLVPMDAHVPLSSLVLNVAQDCNMRCAYCYADAGRYGKDAALMDPALAERLVQDFFDQLGAQRVAHLTFFGGEPLLNMPAIRAALRVARDRAERDGKTLRLGITTNGTLLNEERARFLEDEAFSVTVSIDGPPEVHDRMRTFAGGEASYARVVERVMRTKLHAVARVTLTRAHLDVDRIVRHLIEVGFVEVGVSPVASRDHQLALGPEDYPVVLHGLAQLADEYVSWAREGRRFPFANLRTLMEQLAAGEVRPVPCGAGARLAAADTEGRLYACHRMLGQPELEVGNLGEGLDGRRRFEVVRSLHPRTRSPCGECWARYLCGGGCHHLARVASDGGPPWTLDAALCDFLRGWYRLGLATFARLSREAPAVLSRSPSESALPPDC